MNAVAADYTVGLKISVYKGPPEALVISEESTFSNITFAKMSRLSAEYYELIAKLEKEKK